MSDRTATAEITAPPRWRDVFAGARGRLTIGLLLLEMLVAIQILVVATIMPAVRHDLGDVQLYGWTFSATGLGQFAAIPIAGRAFDRFGAPRLLAVTLLIYTTGLGFAAVAPSMLALVFARLLQGIGGGAIYAVSLGTVAKTYPSDIRARVLALLAAMWILPGLVGPPLGALFAATVGWRYAFLVPIPLLAIAAVLVFPALPRVRSKREPVSLVWPLLLALGAGAVLGGLTDLTVFTIPLVVAGLAVAIPALVRIVPSGTLRARRGMAAAAAAAFLLSVGFLAGDAFVPLMLTRIRGRTIAEAGILLTFMTFAWASGSWWQSRQAVRMSPGKLVAIGGTCLLVGLASLLLALLNVPLAIPYLGWTVAGFGMGIAWPMIPLSVMNASSKGEEASELSSTLLMDTLGVALGSGLAGASVALARSTGASLRVGLAGGFAIGVVACLMLLLVTPRLPGSAAESTV
ncbi:MAG: MFS transporter [Actinomycetota bacterium]